MMKYSCRARLFQSTYDYELAPDRLVRRSQSTETILLFRDIIDIVVFKERTVFWSSRSFWASAIRSPSDTFRLTSAHRVSPTKIEDRTTDYIPFIKEFERTALAANPAIRFTDDEFRESTGTKLGGSLAAFAIVVLRLLKRRQAASFCGRLLSWIGPLLRGHHRAEQQFHAAFPNSTQAERRQKLRGMWNNIGSTFGEYAHVEDLMNFSLDKPSSGVVFMDERTAAQARQLGSKGGGALMFAAHLGNWEIPAMAAQTAGRRIAVVYKRQPSNRMTEQLVRFRSRFAAHLIEARPSAPREILKLLRDGWMVGMLVDQHFPDGIKVRFFGQPCQINPILARLARTGDWPVYGARAVRMPDQRHRFELTGPLEFPRDPSGRIEVQGAMQTVMTLIENWIRQTPDQWMWVHRLLR